MRTIASIFVLGVIATAPFAAHAQTPVLVDREAFIRKIDGLTAQVAELQRQARTTPPTNGMYARPNDAAYQLQYGLQSLNGQLAALQKDLRSLPAFDYANSTPSLDRERNHGWNHDRDRDRERIVIVTPPPPPPVIDDATFEGVIDAIDDQAFSQDKLRVLEDASSSHFFRVDQVMRILDQLPFSNDKLAALRQCAPRILDRANTFRIYDAFTFPNDKARARQILGQ